MKRMFKYVIIGKYGKILLTYDEYHSEGDMVPFAKGLLEGTKVFRNDVTVKVFDGESMIYKIR